MKNMNMKLVLFTLFAIISGQKMVARSWFFENTTDEKITVKLESFDSKKVFYVEDIQAREVGYVNASDFSNKHINIKIDGILVGSYEPVEYLDRYWWKIKKGTDNPFKIEKKGSVVHNDYSFTVINKTDFKLKLDLKTYIDNPWISFTVYCKDTDIEVNAGTSIGDNFPIACGIKSITVSGLLDSQNSKSFKPTDVFKILPWNAEGDARVASDAVFFIRKMTKQEKDVYQKIWKNTVYKGVEYLIELHKKAT